jgi:hypothetical protein
VNEELARVRAENSGHVNAAVTAGYNHRPGMLAILGEMPVPDLVLNIFGGLPALVTLYKIGRERGIGRHFFLFGGEPRL